MRTGRYKGILLLLTCFLLLTIMGLAHAQEPPSTSRNWAGFAINSTGVTAITGSWTVPEIECGNTASTELLSQDVSVWIGIDGLGKAIPEQVGTNSYCLNGSPTYEAWEEDPTLSSGALPAFPEVVSASDHITASITYLGKSQFRLSVADAQTGGSRTFTVIIPNAARASAEWIVEKAWDLNTGNYISLPTFQPVTFSDCSATVNNVTGSILQNHASSISMIDSNGNTIVTPQDLNQAGTSFEVAEVASPVPEGASVSGLLLPALLVAIHVLRRKKKVNTRYTSRFTVLLNLPSMCVWRGLTSTASSLERHHVGGAGLYRIDGQPLQVYSLFR